MKCVLYEIRCPQGGAEQNATSLIRVGINLLAEGDRFLLRTSCDLIDFVYDPQPDLLEILTRVSDGHLPPKINEYGTWETTTFLSNDHPETFTRNLLRLMPSVKVLSPPNINPTIETITEGVMRAPHTLMSLMSLRSLTTRYKMRRTFMTSPLSQSFKEALQKTSMDVVDFWIYAAVKYDLEDLLSLRSTEGVDMTIEYLATMTPLRIAWECS